MSHFPNYFRRPFPSSQGFSPYRFPGLIVHFPVMAGFFLLGLFLCVGQIWLIPLVPVYLIIGLYVGRDLAIYAHYKPLITIAAVGLCCLGAFFGIPLLLLLPGLFRDPPGPLAVSACLISGFVFYVKRHVAAEMKSLEKMKSSEASLLHYAAKYGDVDCCKARLAAGDDPDGSQELDATPLHLAADQGQLKVARLLIAAGADVNRKRKSKFEFERDETPLHCAASNGYPKVARLQIEKGALVDARTFHSYIPLHCAALGGCLEIAEMLIESGTDPRATTHQNETPLAFAEHSHNKKLIRRLAKLTEKGATH